MNEYEDNRRKGCIIVLAHLARINVFPCLYSKRENQKAAAYHCVSEDPAHLTEQGGDEKRWMAAVK